MPSSSVVCKVVGPGSVFNGSPQQQVVQLPRADHTHEVLLERYISYSRCRRAGHVVFRSNPKPDPDNLAFSEGDASTGLELLLFIITRPFRRVVTWTQRQSERAPATNRLPSTPRKARPSKVSLSKLFFRGIMRGISRETKRITFVPLGPRQDLFPFGHYTFESEVTYCHNSLRHSSNSFPRSPKYSSSDSRHVTLGMELRASTRLGDQALTYKEGNTRKR